MRDTIRWADPYGCPAVTPPDEYDAEAGQVVRRLIREARNAADVERIAGDVFEHYFDKRYDGALGMGGVRHGAGRKIADIARNQRTPR